MTYQQEFAADPFAQIAARMPQKYGLKHTDMHALAWHLSAYRSQRAKAGKPCHDDLLRQEATKWAKQMSPTQ